MMMESWVFPLTILPGVGMLILSTTSWAVSLTAEIDKLLSLTHCDRGITEKKINQLSLLNQALVALYICAASCALGGFLGAIWHGKSVLIPSLVNIIVGTGIAFLCLASTLLIIFAYRAVRIKKKQFMDRL